MKLMRGIDAPFRDRYLTYVSYYRSEEVARVLSPGLRAELDGHDPFRYHRAYFDHVQDEHWLNQLLYVDAKTFLPCLNLAYTDKMSMAASTEVRVPILDDEVVALSARIPPDLKLRRLQRKYILKRSMEPVLPKEIVWRPKAGFGAPVRAWLVNELRPMVDDVLSPANVSARGLFDPTTGVYWAVDSFATPVPGGAEATSLATNVADLDGEFWQQGMVMFGLNVLSPWLQLIAPERFKTDIERVRSRGMTTISSAHCPTITNDKLDEAWDRLYALAGVEAPPMPDQSVLDMILEAAQAPS